MPIKSHGTTIIPPTNRNADLYTQEALQVLGPAIQQSQLNSLAANGYPITYYSAVRQGPVCTCAERSVTTLLDQNGNADPSTINSLLQGSSFSINDYTQNTTNMGGSIPNPDMVDTEDFVADGPLASSEDIALVASEYATGVSIGVDTPSGNHCGLCLGSGFLPGFQPVNGERLIFDSQNIVSLHGVIINNSVAPYVLNPSPSGTITWSHQFGKSIQSIQAVRVMNNTEIVPTATVSVIVGGTTYPFTLTTFTPNTTPVAPNIPVSIVVTTTQPITHLEIMLSYSSVPTYGDYSNLQKSGDLSVLRSIDDVTISLGSNIPKVNVYDLIVDNILGRVWRVVQASALFDNQRRLYGWTVAARYVQEYEVFASLLVPTNYYPRFVTSGEYQRGL